MFGLRVIQAEFGDCLLLEYGSAAAPRYFLIDGGPQEIYSRHLKSVLQGLASDGRKLDGVALSHVDGDHITGLIDLFADLRDGGKYIGVDRFWMNSFSGVGPGAGLEAKLRDVAGKAGPAMVNAAATVQTIGDGDALARLALQIGLPPNGDRHDALMSVETETDPIAFDNLSLTVVGPSKANIEALHVQWEEWLDRQADAIASGDVYVMANSDKSTPNLSSLMFYAEADGKSMLLTGDGRSDHLLEGLRTANLLDAHGALHVDLLKLAHHGSNRNVTRTFFSKVTADLYVASANGKDDNPDLTTLIWIVEAAQKEQRPIRIFVTNETESTQKLLDDYLPTDYFYTLDVLGTGKSSHLLKLA